MSLTTKQIEEQREQAQEDIRTILDSCSIAIDDEQVDKVCQVIVDRMNILRDANAQSIPDGSIGTCPSCRRKGKVDDGCPYCPGFWYSLTPDEDLAAGEEQSADPVPDGSPGSILGPIKVKAPSLPPARPFFTDEFGDMENSRE